MARGSFQTGWLVHNDRWNGRHAGRAALAAISAILLIAPTGCGRSRTASEVKREYAMKLLDGFSIGYYDVRAERADPNTLILSNLTIERNDTLIHADEAEIIVDPKSKSISLRLQGVVGASAESGGVISLDELKSGSFRIAGALKPE